MKEIIYCKDCIHSVCWRSGESASKYGKLMECSINVLACPNDYDFCSKGKKILKCPKCNKIYDVFPNFCSKCGEDLRKNGEQK